MSENQKIEIDLDLQAAKEFLKDVEELGKTQNVAAKFIRGGQLHTSVRSQEISDSLQSFTPPQWPALRDVMVAVSTAVVEAERAGKAERPEPGYIDVTTKAATDNKGDSPAECRASAED